MKIRKNDTVKVIAGKNLGQVGKVLRVLGKENKVWVEGVNLYKKHLKKRGQNEGGIVEISKPFNISNVMVVDPKSNKVTRIGFKFNNGVKERIYKSSGEVIKG